MVSQVWDYDSVASQISRGVEGDRTLSPSTLVCCLSALSTMEYRGSWESMTDEEWDSVEAWVSGAYQELLTSIECGGGEGVQAAVLTYETGEGIDAISLTADVETVIPLNTEYDPYSLAQLVGSNRILLEAGDYLVSGTCSLYASGRGKTWLIDEGDERLLQGVNRDNEDAHIHIQGIISSDGETGFYWTVIGNQSGLLGRNWDQDVNEIYAQITFTLLE